MNTDQMSKRVSAFVEAVNGVGIPSYRVAICQALDRPRIKAEDLSSLLQNVQPVKKSKKRIPCKAYYIQQQRGRKARWAR